MVTWGHSSVPQCKVRHNTGKTTEKLCTVPLRWPASAENMMEAVCFRWTLKELQQLHGVHKAVIFTGGWRRCWFFFVASVPRFPDVNSLCGSPWPSFWGCVCLSVFSHSSVTTTAGARTHKYKPKFIQGHTQKKNWKPPQRRRLSSVVCHQSSESQCLGVGGRWGGGGGWRLR